MDDLQGMSEKTRQCVAEADALRAEGLDTSQKFARFAALMFEAGYNQAQADVLDVLEAHRQTAVKP
jgi:hypothetical protein